MKIDATELLGLLEDNSGFEVGYLDRQTGKILVMIKDCEGPEEQEVEDRIKNGGDRYLEIDPISSRDSFRLMERFVESLPEGQDRDFLFTVLTGRKPFANFKHALLAMGDLRNRWFDFQHKEMLRLATEWLESEGVQAELVMHGATGG